MNMIRYFNQMLKLPISAFVFSVEMFVKTIQGIQKITYHGIDMMSEVSVDTSRDATPGEDYVTGFASDSDIIGNVGIHQWTNQQEERRMAERDLHDDMLKLVRYKILFVKRDFEYAFPEQEELVADNMDGAGYTAWKVAEFIQNLGKTPIPDKWLDKKYPRDASKDVPANPPKSHPTIDRLDEEDKKYLRVYYEVLDRYPRERFKYEERQIEVLEQIRDKMKDS